MTTRRQHPKPPGRVTQSPNKRPSQVTKPPGKAPSPAAAKGAPGVDKAGRPSPPRSKPEPPKPTKPVVPTQYLSVDGLTKVYGDLTALQPLDLRVREGEAVVLLGHNGSGKTTFLRMLSALLEPSGGSATVDGHAIGSLPARSLVSYLSDNPTFYDDLSVWEHLEVVARLHGMADWQQQAADLLDHLGIYERADDLPSRFSRGMRQKAAIAMAFIRPFGVLLVDEPFVGLDAAGKQALLALFDSAHQEGATLLVATHELAFVDRVERCIALRDGGLIHDGPTAGIDVLALVS